MLNKPFTELRSYVAYLRSVEFPVLRRTEHDLATLKEDEDNVSARQIAGCVLQDPLMALKLMIHLQRNRGRTQNHDITTIERAIMMLGVTPFFRRFDTIPTVEDQLASHPRALLGVLKVITRAKRAAYYARDWALLRHDIDVDEVTVAALLHEVAEILCWCFAPDLIQAAFALQKANPGMRSAIAQKTTMGISIPDLQIALVREYELPELLITLMDGEHPDNPRVRTVQLACDLARHAANGWEDPALPDDFRAISDLLRLDVANVMQRVGVPPDAPVLAIGAQDPPADSAAV
ncbi:HDOD domain-containing protein [Niveibacterium umoris]|uniref:HD-like signal output (HDOD) protein n=1 Tax=Niveibacterium umoris TaxID=1193620 RepID=A0A840BND9_9RHOO|nr:HDOD domain-containing protein [Niveibacterium umoris]MBB4012356.1 HD-like signal output (HDOD) protein [Niveibacterium umoris]